MNWSDLFHKAVICFLLFPDVLISELICMNFASMRTDSGDLKLKPSVRVDAMDKRSVMVILNYE